MRFVGVNVSFSPPQIRCVQVIDGTNATEMGCGRTGLMMNAQRGKRVACKPKRAAINEGGTNVKDSEAEP